MTRDPRRDLFFHQGVGRPRWDVLATYNGEVSRGIVHTAEWDALMAELQAAFNESARRDSFNPEWHGYGGSPSTKNSRSY